MACYMLVRHKVRDFAQWQAGYATHLPKRVQAGLEEKYLLRGAADPNEVVVMFEALDLDRAKAFATSTDLAETMQKVGVIGQPDIWFLRD